MAYSAIKFDAAVCAVVAAIPPGQVMSYGAVARAAGYPRHARMVSKALQRARQALPWHRVVRADHSLAFAVGSEAYQVQQGLLQQEGVLVRNGKVTVPQASNLP